MTRGASWARRTTTLLAVDTVAVTAILTLGAAVAQDHGTTPITDPWSAGSCPTAGPRLVDAADVCYSPAAVQARRVAATSEAVGLAARYRCTPPGLWPHNRIPARAIVRRDTDDRVQVLTFGAAWAQAKAGKVWTLYLCPAVKA